MASLFYAHNVRGFIRIVTLGVSLLGMAAVDRARDSVKAAFSHSDIARGESAGMP
jgi:hypothetical protein